jgi:putative membrane protein
MGLIWVAIVALIAWAIWYIVPRRRASDRSDALEILDTRFAKGEIDRAEYEERRRILMSKPE